MSIHFHLNYRTAYGEQLAIRYFTNQDDAPIIIACQTYDGENWTTSLALSHDTIYYNYVLISNGAVILQEWGKARSIEPSSQSNDLFLLDYWRSRANEDNAFYASAFSNAIFKRESKPTNLLKENAAEYDTNAIKFVYHGAAIPAHLVFGICGSSEALGSWKIPVLLDETNFPNWETVIPCSETNVYLEYKYVICDKDRNIVAWEEGDNRHTHFVFSAPKNTTLIITDENFRYSNNKWRGSGVAIPVFSLRSKNGLGIGEFQDLKPLITWSKDLGMKMIQILPVNDTLANKTWADSYPYAAISVFALHPLYVNLDSIASLKNKTDQKTLLKLTAELNKLEVVDFEKVLETKFTFLKKLFEQEYENFIHDVDAQSFISENASWLPTYAVFCHLRDIHHSCNFNLWPKYKTFSPEIIDTLCNEHYEGYKDIQFYYFIQYHADKQLYDAKLYARAHGVVLKGDLPIGIYRYSADAWVAPDLYNMNEQAGAPPDDYAVLGQNWGFPTYNWSIMAKDGFQWWRNRMKQLNRHFDALRIDHILGFFRIWQIPTNQVEGTMGSFNPRLPMSREELAQYGILGDLRRYTKPFITDNRMVELFGSDVDEVFQLFFNRQGDGSISLKSSFDTQQEIAIFLAQNPTFKKYEVPLLGIVSDVLLLVEPNSDGQMFNPRITLNTTYSYRCLDHSSKQKIDALYNDYYFKRHDMYWKEQALWKLPAILDASDMLICGEDLGMIPKAVPGVMRDLNIISLEIQRMPKGNSKFGQVSLYPYFSVCSPSCHDMSTIRGWWQGDHENAKDYYYNYLKWYGLTPMDCTPEIVQAIVDDHLMSPSMLAIFPIQDLIGMDGDLRRKDAFSEQINDPSNSKHYWRYRFHMNVEDLMSNVDLNNRIRSMIKKSGR